MTIATAADTITWHGAARQATTPETVAMVTPLSGATPFDFCFHVAHAALREFRAANKALATALGGAFLARYFKTSTTLPNWYFLAYPEAKFKTNESS